MRNSTRTLATAALAGLLAAGPVSGPALAAGHGGDNGKRTPSSSSVKQDASTSARITQNSGIKVLPHRSVTYSGDNTAVVDQEVTTDATTGAGRTARVEQNAANSTVVDQGNFKVLPHGSLTYTGDNTAHVEQSASNSATTKGSGKARIKQNATNSAVIEQGTVREFPHSTVVRSGGQDTASVEQTAGNYTG